MNAYAYAANSPIDLFDPFGMDDKWYSCTGTRIQTASCSATHLCIGCSGWSSDVGVTYGEAYQNAKNAWAGVAGVTPQLFQATVDFLMGEGSFAQVVAAAPYTPQSRLDGAEFIS